MAMRWLRACFDSQLAKSLVMKGYFRNPAMVRGERPTRAGLHPVRKYASALRRVTGRGARTRAAPRGVVLKWSDACEVVRFRVVAQPVGAPFRVVGIAWRPLGVVGRVGAGCSFVHGACLAESATKMASLMTEGTLTLSALGWSGAVRGWYKQCEIRPRCGGGVVGLDHVSGELSISQLRPDSRLGITLKVTPGTGSTLRGVTVVEG